MKNIDLGQTIAVLANLGVIAGIVFLAFELQQNNELLAAQARAVRHEFRLSDYLLPMNNRDLASALIKHRNGDELTEYEQLLLDRSMSVNLGNFQFVYTEYQRGLIEESAISIDDWANSFDGTSLLEPGHWPDMSDYWEATKHRFDSDFVEWMDENVVNR